MRTAHTQVPVGVEASQVPPGPVLRRPRVEGAPERSPTAVTSEFGGTLETASSSEADL
jgi:hypothetical protein